MPDALRRASLEMDAGAADWPLAPARVWPGLRVLRAPANPAYDIDGGPQAPAGSAQASLERLFGAAKGRAGAPRVIVAHAVTAEGPAWRALEALHAAGSIRLAIVADWRRAMLERAAAPDAAAYFAAFMSAGARKRLRQKRKALEDGGALALTIGASTEAIASGFETFCALESLGWKGRNGTALAQDPAGRAYVAAKLLSGADDGAAFTAVLSSAGRPVAAGLFLRKGGEAAFWKTTYDETLAKLSPGVVFDVMLTEWLYAQDWFERLDSGHDDSVDPDGLIWKQRRRMAHIVVDLAPGSWRGRAVAAGLGLRQRLRAWRNARQAAK
jgi:CelD/BcsL family acetyltransferase involved in cellulose biosynthesis